MYTFVYMTHTIFAYVIYIPYLCAMKRIRLDLKDYLVARDMFGSNTKEQCNLVKKLRSNGVLIPHCEGWYLITDKNKPDDIGWLVSEDNLEDIP